MKRAIRLNSNFGRILGKGILGNGICSQRADCSVSKLSGASCHTCIGFIAVSLGLLLGRFRK